MKTIVQSFIVLALSIFSLNQAIAQCTVSNIVIQNVSVAGVQAPGTCTVKFDASFTIENNNGNKYIFVHAWLQQNYPNYFQCENGHTTLNGAIHAPEAADLAAAFINIGIDNDAPIPEIITEYPPDPTVPMANVDSISREVLPDGSAVFILYGVTATLPVSCGTPVVIVADLWSSQSARAQVAHCVNCGILYSAGFISVSGLVNCINLTFNALLTNNTAGPISGYYRVYADINGDGYFTPAIDTLVQDTTNFTVGAGVGVTAAISGTLPSENLNQDVFIVVTQTSGAASGASRVILLPSTQCSPLPVTFQSFRATRINRSSVGLRWETATEINNSGFAVQRNLGNNTWEFVAFVPSQSIDGNSNNTLLYTFNDANSHKGISQYRIRQVDLDGRTRLSDIRAVRGFDQKGETIVYPVPSSNGTVNVVFENAEVKRDLLLTDMSGRTIRQWHSVSSNTHTIENLRTGIYMLRIQDVGTNKVTIEKIIISSN